ncbi:SDR family oxidoreductase [Mesorhizobium sp. M0500]
MVAGDADQAGLDKLEAELNRTGQNVSSKAGDLRDKAYWEDLIDYSIHATGCLDVLVNNAGIITRGSTDDRRRLRADVRRQSDIDILHLPESHWSREGPRQRRDRQHLFVLGAISRSWPPYCTSKAAVASFTKCLGRDHAPDGIRVNAVCPNEVNTPMIRTGFVRRGFDPDNAIAELNKSVPLGRIAEPEDIADVVLFLYSDAARYIAGTVVEVNGAKPVY